MISDTKPQNILIVATIVIGLISGFGLASSAAWYSGSYSIVRYLEVDMTEIRVGNFGLENMSLTVTFKVEAPSIQTGEAQITFFRMVVYLNGESFSYTTFQRSVPLELRTVTPAYNHTFGVGSTILSEIDRQIILDASAAEEWVFSVGLTVFYDIFESPGDQVRQIAYSYNGTPLGVPL
ncbi:MAG: hypothetical protein P1Q69_18120 [Candidatus Thorarchaeota archaeon]|nr:hypothetical protein [Candidatus Thorarchaeota archaeon]